MRKKTCLNPFCAAGDSCRLPPGKLPLATVVDWSGVNTANCLHSSMYTEVTVSESCDNVSVDMSKHGFTFSATLLFVGLEKRVRFGRFSVFFRHMSVRGVVQWTGQRGKGLSR